MVFKTNWLASQEQMNPNPTEDSETSSVRGVQEQLWLEQTWHPGSKCPLLGPTARSGTQLSFCCRQTRPVRDQQSQYMILVHFVTVSYSIVQKSEIVSTVEFCRFGIMWQMSPLSKPTKPNPLEVSGPLPVSKVPNTEHWATFLSRSYNLSELKGLFTICYIV